MNGKTDILRRMISESARIVFFGGAGVSTESGIPDFRSAEGLYAGEHMISPEVVLSRSFFMENPGEFFSFYREKLLYPRALPNEAHRRLVFLERRGKLSAVVTQNIDGLHQAAGSRNVLELHGSVHRNYCMECGRTYGLDYVLRSEGIPRCACGGIVRPDVVLYGERLDEEIMEKAARAISEADMLIVGGTSLSVYPAAGLIRCYSGRRLVLINKTPTPFDEAADLQIAGSVGQALAGAVEES